jgi:hypothetical protein
MPAHLLFAHGVDRREGSDVRYAPVSRLAFSGSRLPITRARAEHPDVVLALRRRAPAASVR